MLRTVFSLAHKINNVSPLMAAKAVIDIAVRADGKGARSLVVERANTLPVSPHFFEGGVVAGDIKNGDVFFDGVKKVHTLILYRYYVELHCMITRIRGTQDFCDLTLWNFFINQVRRHCVQYHFTEIKTPILESSDLFIRSLGAQTDVVSKEMFFVGSQHAEAGDEKICLRPELTAPVMRVYLENGAQEKPWKIFSVGSVFRYERPQKGRFREFHQVTIETIGARSIAHDISLITMLDRFFSEKLKLDSYALSLNFLGCFADREQFKKALDEFLSKNSEKMCATCQKRQTTNILRVLDCKNPQCQEAYKTAPKITDFLCAACAAEWQTVRQDLEALSVSFTVVPTLVRGLDYYDKTVFEFSSPLLGAQSAFCGGGRYNGLAQVLGSAQEIPAVGAGIGIERVLLLLEQKKESLLVPQPEKLFALIPVTAEQQTLALLLADELYAAGLTVEVIVEGESLKSMMRKANKLGAAAALFVGPEEQQSGTVKIKNMMTGAEESVKQVDLARALGQQKS